MDDFPKFRDTRRDLQMRGRRVRFRMQDAFLPGGRVAIQRFAMFVSVYEREAGKRENMTPKSVHLCALVKHALTSTYARETQDDKEKKRKTLLGAAVSR